MPIDLTLTEVGTMAVPEGNVLPLVEAGLLERTERESLRSTAQRYRLTKVGRQYLAERRQTP